jgi:NAD(P)-dependent dehydrogenase (short-subunit alcohol dehydrogenase family)
MSERATIAVTGASRGIGAAIAFELARRGFPVACLTRGGTAPAPPPGEEALAARLSTCTCDVTDEASLAAAFRAVAERPGGLAGLVNNAGVHITGPSERFATEEFARVLAVNATGLFAASREAFPFLTARGGGLIVNLGSFFDRMGVPHNTAYTASKAAVAAITRCLAVEWAAQGVRVLNVAPGYVATDLNREFFSRPRNRAYIAERVPLKRPGNTGEIARFVAALFCEDVPYLTGETIYVDGGHGIAH